MHVFIHVILSAMQACGNLKSSSDINYCQSALFHHFLWPWIKQESRAVANVS